MATPYSTTFTLVAGGVTITLNVRPDSILWGDNVMISQGPIPGAGQSFFQHMGTGGTTLEFQIEIWNITSITMGAAVNAEDIMMQLRAWFNLGTTVEVTCDNILERNGGNPYDMKIAELSITEMAGTPHLYSIRIRLDEFNAGSAL